LVAD
jgi:hypothetical protein